MTIGGNIVAGKKSNYGKFYKGNTQKGTDQKLPKGMKSNPGKRKANDTIYHDSDADRTDRDGTWKRDDGNGDLPKDWGQDK
jgi:hypothetical protein